MLSSYTKMSLLRGKKTKRNIIVTLLKGQYLTVPPKRQSPLPVGSCQCPLEHCSSVESTAPMEDVALCRHPAASLQALFCLMSRKIPYMCLNMVR